MDLDSVTVCAADTANRELAARALEISTARCRFADAILFTDAAPRASAFRVVPIAKIASRADYSRFVLRQLHAAIATPFALVVQWDGYVVDPAAWLPEFLRYDYIGAKWPWYADGMNVGNGGFSLRSRRFLEATADPRLPLEPGLGEDELACRRHRRALESEYGLRFAPAEVADRFSYERSAPARPTFGFHGLFNFWRHVGDAEMVALAPALAQTGSTRPEYLELVARCFEQRRPDALRALCAPLRAQHDPEEIARLLAAVVPDARLVADCVAACEAARPAAPPAPA